MEMNGSFGPQNGIQTDTKVWQNFQKSFSQVQNILDQNRLLISEINQNQESKMPDNLTRNVGMIRELNNNIGRVKDLYSGLSSTFIKEIETLSEGDSAGTSSSDRNPGVASGQKRNRPV
uniref:Protein EARLY FLOWERING 4 domain-containing protein n=1 Tax=Araucaria cunninghamii TaxID=56994 RepID=A0A0D6R7Z6_ARACU